MIAHFFVFHTNFNHLQYMYSLIKIDVDQNTMQYSTSYGKLPSTTLLKIFLKIKIFIERLSKITTIYTVQITNYHKDILTL